MFFVRRRSLYVEYITVTLPAPRAAQGAPPAERQDQQDEGGHDRHRCSFHVGRRSAADVRSTNRMLTNEKTSSPAWLVPVLRANTSPLSGRLCTSRVSITSLAKLI